MAGEILSDAGTKSLYIPAGYAAREMLFGSSWTKINIGVRVNLRDKLPGSTTPPALGSRMWFGVCSGTTAPIGSPTPAHFIGFRSSANPIIYDAGKFIVNWSIVSVENGVQTIHDQYAAGPYSGKISRWADGAGDYSDNFYAQFERLTSTSMKVTLLIPGLSSNYLAGEALFMAAVDSSVLSTAINQHEQHFAINKTFNFNVATYGELNCVNLMTTIPDQTSGSPTIASLRWLSVRAKKFA